MTDYVRAGLAKRRAELAGEADKLHARSAQIGTDLGHLDAVIRQFDPDYDLGSIRPKRPRTQDAAGRGDMSRFIMRVLREASEPVATHEVVRLMTERGQDAGDRRLGEEHDGARGHGVQPAEGGGDGAGDPGDGAGHVVENCKVDACSFLNSYNAGIIGFEVPLRPAQSVRKSPRKPVLSSVYLKELVQRKSPLDKGSWTSASRSKPPYKVSKWASSATERLF